MSTSPPIIPATQVAAHARRIANTYGAMVDADQRLRAVIEAAQAHPENPPAFWVAVLRHLGGNAA